MPGFVDHVIVVDDGSGDATAAIARRRRGAPRRQRTRGRGARPRPEPRRRGRDRAPATRARWRSAPTRRRSWRATARWIRPICPRLLSPIVDGAADYAKGNRFAWPGGWRQMPAVRLAGQRGALLADARGVGVLAAVRFAVRLHGGVATGAGGDRPRADVRALRISQRSAGAPGRRRRARRRRAGAAGLRSRLAFGPASVARGVADRLAPPARVRASRRHLTTLRVTRLAGERRRAEPLDAHATEGLPPLEAQEAPCTSAS